MAILGKIRKRGVTLIIIIGLGLFAFIAEEAFRSCEATSNEKRQQVGEVLGQKISVQEFQELVDEYQEVIKMTQGRDNFTDEELNQLKDQVWNTYVQNALVADEAEKLGLTVTDAELQNVIKEGSNPMLMQTPFVNQQTGRFDASMLTKFLADYKNIGTQNPQVAEQYNTIYKYWKYIEKTMRQQILAMKYQSLIAHSLITNSISAKMAFEAENNESDIQLAALPYSGVKDTDVKVSDADLKAKYEEKKEMFRQFAETRDIKYVDFQVVASDADRKELFKTMTDAQAALEKGDAPAEVVRKAQSQIAYTGIAVTKNALPYDIKNRIDSMSVGETTKPFETASDNTLNVVKLISKASLPDSVECRQLFVAGATADETAKRADSIYNAIKGGADIEALAKKYGQDATKRWITSSMYENSPSIDADTKALIEAFNTSAVGEVKNLSVSQGNIILVVTDRKAMKDKYVVAIVKHSIDFSKTTYSAAYNKFSQFVSENQTIDGLEKNAAKYGFKVLERADMSSAEHYVAGVRATRDAMKWVFDAEKGQISPLYECGNNDHLLVVAVTNIHKEGYRKLEDVKDMLKAEVIKDKKFELLKSKLAGAKSIADAKAKGAQVLTVSQVTFAAPVFVQATGASEPALSGAVAATKAGQMCSHVVKGNGGAYMLKVVKSQARQGAKYDEKVYTQKLNQQALQAAGRFMNELYMNAGVKDKRYLFF